MDHLDPSWGLGNADLIQQLATLRWIKEGDQGKKYMENVTQLRVGYELWQRVSGQRELDALRNQTILSISKYVKDNPRASKEQLAAEVARQIQEFANKVENL